MITPKMATNKPQRPLKTARQLLQNQYHDVVVNNGVVVIIVEVEMTMILSFRFVFLLFFTQQHVEYE